MYIYLFVSSLVTEHAGSAEYGGCPEQGVGRIAKPSQASHLEAGDPDVCI
jgi:hypothetical protein